MAWVTAGRRTGSGPYVVCSLSGLNPDAAWTEWVDSVDTNEVPRNLRLLMAVRHLTDQLWIDESSLAPFLQTSRQEASGLLGPSRRTHDGRSTHTGSGCGDSVGQHARVLPHIDCDQLAGGGLSQARSGASPTAPGRSRPKLRAASRQDQHHRTRLNRRCRPVQRGHASQGTGIRRCAHPLVSHPCWTRVPLHLGRSVPINLCQPLPSPAEHNS